MVMAFSYIETWLSGLIHVLMFLFIIMKRRHIVSKTFLKIAGVVICCCVCMSDDLKTVQWLVCYLMLKKRFWAWTKLVFFHWNKKLSLEKNTFFLFNNYVKNVKPNEGKNQMQIIFTRSVKENFILPHWRFYSLWPCWHIDAEYRFS